jgi:hypothetical protein
MPNDSTEQTPQLAATFAPLEAAILTAFALRSGSAKPLASMRPLVWLAYIALAQWFGLAHLVTPALREAAFDAARRPGRRKNESSQLSMFDLVPSNDGRPGVYVAFVRLKLGNVHERQGDTTLDLTGITELPDALVKAYEQGWIGGPSGNGLRFIPPTVWSLVEDHNSAGFARRGGVDEYIATLEETNRQWQSATGTSDPEVEKDISEQRMAVIDRLTKDLELSQATVAQLGNDLAIAKTSIAESARLPNDDSLCTHKHQSQNKGDRTCDDCSAKLPPVINGRTKSATPKPTKSTHEKPAIVTKRSSKKTSKKGSRS